MIESLTNREIDVLNLLVDGYTNAEVGIILGISHRTVEVHRSRIYYKTGCHNVAELSKKLIISNVVKRIDEDIESHKMLADKFDDGETKEKFIAAIDSMESLKDKIIQTINSTGRNQEKSDEQAASNKRVDQSESSNSTKTR